MANIYTGAVLALVGVAWYYSDTINTVLKRIKIMYNLAQSMDRPTTPVTLTISDTDETALLTYNRLNTQYTVSLPYNRRKVASMNQFTVHLLYKNQGPLNITQEPGIPYIVSANQLGGVAIEVIDSDTGNKVTYSGDQIPMYCVEVIE